MTTAKPSAYNAPMTLNAQRYKSLREDVESGFDLREKDLREQLRALESERLEAVKLLNETWPKLGGSEEDIVAFESGQPVPSINGQDANGTTQGQDDAPAPGRLIGRFSGVQGPLVDRYVQRVMADPEIVIVTQTEIKDRILADFHVNKGALNSLRVSITMRLNELVERGYLELVEKARAGQPNKYRKTGVPTEAKLLES